MRVNDPTAIKIITAVFDWLPAEDSLLPLSPASFRSRFDRCLRTLGLPDGSFTPGGLRSGGVVCAYHRGYSVKEIQWLMRLAHLQTLSFYLQEVAASPLWVKLRTRQDSASATPALSTSPSLRPLTNSSCSSSTVPRRVLACSPSSAGRQQYNWYGWPFLHGLAEHRYTSVELRFGSFEGCPASALAQWPHTDVRFWRSGKQRAAVSERRVS